MLIAGSPEFVLFTLVIMRMSGFVFFNPVFGRRNLPNIFKLGLTFVISLIIVPTVDFPGMEISNSLMYGILMVMELAIGYIIGTIMYIYEMVVVYAGTIIDFQMGLAMANVYDPQTGLQIAMTGSILQVFYLLMFFAVDGHLALIQILMSTHEIIPYGTASISPEASRAVIDLFSACISLGVRLALPIVAFELLVTAGMAILMKMIPQINLFVMSIQLRVIVGVFMMGFLIFPMGEILETMVYDLMEDIWRILNLA